MKPEFIQAVKEKDVYTVRSYITSEIIEDPTFANKNLEECLDYVRVNNVDIFEEYNLTPCETEVPDDVSKWDRDLFYNKVEDLLHNFAYNERIVDIKRIGKHVYSVLLKEEGHQAFQEAPEIHRSGKKIKWLPIIIGVAVLEVVATVIAILMK